MGPSTRVHLARLPEVLYFAARYAVETVYQALPFYTSRVTVGRGTSRNTALAAPAFASSGVPALRPREVPTRGAAAGLWLLLAIGSIAATGCGYNSLVGADEEVKAAWAQVENVYQRRADLVPNLVATVKGSAAHEQQTLGQVTQARAEATRIHVTATELNDPAKVRAFEEAQAKLSAGLGRLLAVAESYPDLKANANFRDLQAQLEGTENRIAVERRRYTEAVQSYNTKTRSFPTLIAAKIWGFQPRAAFQATTAGAEQAPVVKF